MAAPHVTGVVGLMLGINPNLTPEQVKQILVASARPHVDTSWAMGAGLLDACRAVKLTQGQSMSACDSGSGGGSSGGSSSSSGGGGSLDWFMLVLLGSGLFARRAYRLVQKGISL